MNWSVSAGPAMQVPGECVTGPDMWELAMPARWKSVLEAVAEPILRRPSTSSCGGRVMSWVCGTLPGSIMGCVSERGGWSVVLFGQQPLPGAGVEEVQAGLVEGDPDRLVGPDPRLG